MILPTEKRAASSIARTLRCTCRSFLLLTALFLVFNFSTQVHTTPSAHAETDSSTTTEQPTTSTPTTSPLPTTPTVTGGTITEEDSTPTTTENQKPKPSPGTSGSGGGSANGSDAKTPTPFDPLSTSNSILPLDSSDINKLDIPPLAYLPIYEAAGAECSVDKYTLMAIHRIETNFSRNLNTSSAGAEGPMQFMPATWKTHGMDADHNGKKDIQNPIDAIFAAACYLKASGYEKDPGQAIYAYNHAGWYVTQVQEQATLYARYAVIIDSLTSMTQSLFPVAGRVNYQGDFTATRSSSSQPAAPSSTPFTSIEAEPGAPVIATQDGKVVDVKKDSITLEDAYGNKHIYSNLGSVAHNVPAPRQPEKTTDISHSEGETTSTRKATKKHNKNHRRYKIKAKQKKTRRQDQKQRDVKLQPRYREPGLAPTAATITTPNAASQTKKERLSANPQQNSPSKARKERLYANPTRAGAVQAGGQEHLQTGESSIPTNVPIDRYITQTRGVKREDLTLHRLRRGITIYAGTILGHASTKRPVRFAMQPFGGPAFNPTPILNNIQFLQQTGFEKIWRNQLKDTKLDGKLTPGQALLMSKPGLQAYILQNSNFKIYPEGRGDIRKGMVDRRILATLAFLEASGYKLTITSLISGHSFYTAGGNVSAHPFGCAVDIAAVNDTPILNHQGPGSITDKVVRKLLELSGTYRPAQIITLMKYEGAPNTLALGDHDDHIHVGCTSHKPGHSNTNPLQGTLTKQQWEQLIRKLQKIKPPKPRHNHNDGSTSDATEEASVTSDRPVLDIAPSKANRKLN